MAISQVVIRESFMPYLSAIRPVAQAGMRRAVGAGQEDCPLRTSATRILDVTATSHLVRGSVILAGMRTTPTARVAGGAGDVPSSLAIPAWRRGTMEKWWHRAKAVLPGPGAPGMDLGGPNHSRDAAKHKETQRNTYKHIQESERQRGVTKGTKPMIGSRHEICGVQTFVLPPVPAQAPNFH